MTEAKIPLAKDRTPDFPPELVIERRAFVPEGPDLPPEYFLDVEENVLSYRPDTETEYAVYRFYKRVKVEVTAAIAEL